MKAFTQVAILHEDILEGKLTMDIFAADLWQVANGKAPPDYQDADLFFRKTYLTKGLKNIIEIAKQRLKGKRGDAVIQLQTPFGGGKTHTLIALYHKAKEWDASVVVFDGTALNPVPVGQISTVAKIASYLKNKFIMSRLVFMQTMERFRLVNMKIG